MCGVVVVFVVVCVFLMQHLVSFCLCVILVLLFSVVVVVVFFCFGIMVVDAPVVFDVIFVVVVAYCVWLLCVF